MPIKDQYSELLKMTSPCEKLIRRDIARTYPEHNFFKEKDSLGQEVLFNVMKVSFIYSFFEVNSQEAEIIHIVKHEPSPQVSFSEICH